MKKAIANFIMILLYYFIVGIFAFFVKIIGFNPFFQNEEASTYWLTREKNHTYYRFTLKNREQHRNNKRGG